MGDLGEIIVGLFGIVLIIGIIALAIAYPLPVIAVVLLLILMRS